LAESIEQEGKVACVGETIAEYEDVAEGAGRNLQGNEQAQQQDTFVLS
jgi:hypothetical protein